MPVYVKFDYLRPGDSHVRRVIKLSSVRSKLEVAKSGVPKEVYNNSKNIIKGWDYDSKGYRQFYDGAIRNAKPISFFAVCWHRFVNLMSRVESI